MRSRGARIAFIVVGAVALLIGLVWIGQGLGYIPGSFMTGDRTWFTIGLIVAIVGAVLVYAGVRRGRARSR